MTKIKKTAFFYPTQDENASSASPNDQANDTIMKKERQNNALINMTEGNLKKEGFATNNQIDNIHYHQETTEYMPYSDFQDDVQPEGASTQYPFTHRLGNSSTKAQGIVKYENKTGINTGPFNIYVQKE